MAMPPRPTSPPVTRAARVLLLLAAVGVLVQCQARDEGTAAAPLEQEAAAAPLEQALPPATRRPAAAPPDRARLHEACILAAAYLVAACGEDGQFEYLTHPDPDVALDPEYNELRHAGTMYALAMYDQWHPDAAARAALERAGRFLRERCIRPVEEWPGVLAVWLDPEISRDSGPLVAKLGGTGLALVALLSLERVAPGSTPREDLAQLGSFLLHMQKPDGSFYSKYIPAQGGRSNRWTSLYYPGEAALGLVMLYEHDGDARWLRAAGDAIAYLARSRAGQKTVPADHWALLATARLLPHADTASPPIARQPMIEHAAQIVRAVLRDQVRHDDNPALIGGFVRDGRTTPTSTRLEGLLAAMEFLPADLAQLRHMTTSAIDRGIGFLLNSQVRQGEHAGAIPRSVRKLAPGHPGYSPSANRRADEVRIDYVQHALSAFIQYDAFAAQRDHQAP
jgi:hypothetical protein